jgi:hypothetical protein
VIMMAAETYSYCWDTTACNYMSNSNCDYSCHNTVCQSNFHVENGSCVSDPITCKEVDGELQLEYSN